MNQAGGDIMCVYDASLPIPNLRDRANRQEAVSSIWNRRKHHVVGVGLSRLGDGKDGWADQISPEMEEVDRAQSSLCLPHPSPRTL